MSLLGVVKSVATISLLVCGIIVAAILVFVALDWIAWAREAVVIVRKEW